MESGRERRTSLGICANSASMDDFADRGQHGRDLFLVCGR